MNDIKQLSFSDLDIAFLRTIRIVCCSTSIFAGLVFILVYFINYLTNKNLEAVINQRSSFVEENDTMLKSLNTSRNNNNKKRRGKSVMGSNLILCVILANIGSSIAALINNDHNVIKESTICQVQASLLSFFDLSVVSWITVITTIINSLIFSSSLLKFKRKIKLLIAYATVFPLVLTLGYIVFYKAHY
jgi:hypothetical protein